MAPAGRGVIPRRDTEMPKPKEFGQFDQGEGQRYAEEGKPKKKGNGKPRAQRTSSPTDRNSVRDRTTLAERARRDMKATRRRTLRMGI